MSQGARSWGGVIGLAALVGLVGWGALDGRPLWTDELGTWALTQPPTWRDWALAFWTHSNSDGQLPLYHAYMRAWVLMFGDGELALRASNLPWLLVALLGLSRVSLPAAPRRWILAVALGHAFIWYYLNDARPYVMYVAGASWLTAGVFRMCLSNAQARTMDQGLREGLLGCVLLLGGNILGAFWIASSLVAMCLLSPALILEVLRAMRRQWGWTAVALLACVAIVGVALHSHFGGARASQAAAFSMAGMGYGLIELVGAAGLGPSRNDLRGGMGGADKWQLVSMAALALLSGIAVLVSWWQSRGTRVRLSLLVAAAGPLFIMMLMGVVLHWRVVGRHLSAMLPIVIVGMAAFGHWAWVRRRSALPAAMACLLAVGLLASTVSVRWAERHGKDDYRQAAAWAREALSQGHTVLWLADGKGLRYYGLAEDRRSPAMVLPSNLIPFAEYPQRKSEIPLPDVVVFSPREGVDPGGLARPVLASGHYERTASAVNFELYVKRQGDKK